MGGGGGGRGEPCDDPSDSTHPDDRVSHFQTSLNEGRDTPPGLIAGLDQYEQLPAFSELDSRITSSDVEKALKRLKKKAAPGVEKISAELLIAGETYLIPLFVLMFNKVFTFAAYSVLWT